MDKDTFIKYGPIACVVLAIIFQWNLFVTPEKLEIKHREIMHEVAETYTTKEQHNDVKQELQAMRQKIDKIYDVVTRK